MSLHTRTFPSTTDAAADATVFIAELAEELGFPEHLLDPLLLVVGEAVANAAKHGNALDPARSIVVGFAWEGDLATFFVEDEGMGVPVERLAHASLPEDVLATSGRGLFIIQTLADRVWLENGGRRIYAAWEVDRG